MRVIRDYKFPLKIVPFILTYQVIKYVLKKIKHMDAFAAIYLHVLCFLKDSFILWFSAKLASWPVYRALFHTKRENFLSLFILSQGVLYVLT